MKEEKSPLHQLALRYSLMDSLTLYRVHIAHWKQRKWPKISLSGKIDIFLTSEIHVKQREFCSVSYGLHICKDEEYCD